jgi:hypothetical protein
MERENELQKGDLKASTGERASQRLAAKSFLDLRGTLPSSYFTVFVGKALECAWELKADAFLVGPPLGGHFGTMQMSA